MILCTQDIIISSVPIVVATTFPFYDRITLNRHDKNTNLFYIMKITFLLCHPGVLIYVIISYNV